MKKAIFLTFGLFFAASVCAQQWDWAVMGGNNHGSQNDECTVVELTTDKAGNVYILAEVASNHSFSVTNLTKVAGHVFSYSGDGGTDIVLASLTPAGQYRWGTLIGARASDKAKAIKLDGNGGVYITGNVSRVSTTPVIFGNDSILALPQYPPNQANCQNLFLAKYDTAGNFKWLRMPDADTANPLTGNISKSVAIAVTNNNDIYWFCNLKPGALPNTSFQITQEGYYVVRYNAAGNIEAVSPKFDVDLENIYPNFDYFTFVYDSVYQRFYIGGIVDYDNNSYVPPIYIGNDTVGEGNVWMAAFDNNAQILWLKKTNSQAISPEHSISDICIDNNHNIIFTGGIVMPLNNNNQIGFNGYVYTSPESSAAAYITKLSPNGNTLWANLAVNKSAGGSLAIESHHEIAIAANAGAGLYWQRAKPGYYDTLQTNPPYRDPFIARFDLHTGELIDMEISEPLSGSLAYATAIAAAPDGTGYFMGGQYDYKIAFGADTLEPYHPAMSFFVAKYGACIGPLASFAANNPVAGTFNFVFNGGLANTITWDFGDNSPTATGDSVSHTYTATGQYNVCVTATNPCDTTTFCDTVTVSTVNTQEIIAKETLQFTLSPNPAENVVKIRFELPNWQSSTPTEIEVYDVQGRFIQQKAIYQQQGALKLNITEWQAGVYFISLKTNNQVQAIRKLVVR